MIFEFRGNMRGGKTLGMTIWGILLSSATKQHIYSNYHLNWPNYTYFSKWRDLKNVKNSIILFDEIATSMDSRNYKSGDQIYFTHLFQQMGKLGNTFIYSAQREHTVEKRIRENTDYLIDCTRLYPAATLIQTWYDTQRSTISPKYIREWLINDPTPFYKFYNTYEVIESNINLHDSI